MEMNAEYKTHLFRYRYAGAEWQVKIHATDAEDARQRLGRLTWATYDGVEVSDQPIMLAPIGMITVWVRNAAAKFLSRFLPTRRDPGATG